MLSRLDRRIADAMITFGVDVQRYQSNVRNKVLGIVSSLDAELVKNLVKADIAGASPAVLKATLKSSQAVIREHYEELAILTNEQVAGLAQIEAKATMSALRETREILKKPTALAHIEDRLLVFGGPIDDWWLEQGSKVQFAFGNAVRQGMQNGETIRQIVDRIHGNEEAAGLMQTTKKSAMFLARDVLATASNQTRLEVFQRNRDVIKGFMQVSTLDNATSDICIAYSGATWNLDYEPMGDNDLPFDGGCPRHRNCRSTIVPITEHPDGEESFETTQRASENGPVRSNITFEEWLSGRTEEQQNEQLGRGKAQLWRDGKITLRDLLDRDANQLTLEQLRKKYDN